MAKRGRPSKYNEETARYICVQLVLGRALVKICQDNGMPDVATVYRWLDLNKDFRDKYAQAREDQADTLADEIQAISDEECTIVRSDKHPNAKADEDGNLEVVFDAVAVARNRLRVDARKWIASKLKPKKYGDRIQQDINGELKQTHYVVEMPQPQGDAEQWAQSNKSLSGVRNRAPS